MNSNSPFLVIGYVLGLALMMYFFLPFFIVVMFIMLLYVGFSYLFSLMTGRRPQSRVRVKVVRMNTVVNPQPQQQQPGEELKKPNPFHHTHYHSSYTKPPVDYIDSTTADKDKD